MKKLAIAVVVLLGIAAIAYHYRLELMLAAAPRIADLRDPIEPNREVVWSQGPATAALPPAERAPNIIVIVADDMGFNDVSFYNGGAADGSLQTPRIDSIARDGVAFTNGYSANAVCAPSRASIMTGRYSTRFGFEFTPFFKIGVSIFETMARTRSEPAEADRASQGSRCDAAARRERHAAVRGDRGGSAERRRLSDRAHRQVASRRHRRHAAGKTRLRRQPLSVRHRLSAAGFAGRRERANRTSTRSTGWYGRRRDTPRSSTAAIRSRRTATSPTTTPTRL